MVVLFFVSTTTTAFAFGGGRCFSRRETGLFSAKRLDTFSFREQGCQIIFQTQSCYCFTEIGKMILVLSQNFIAERDTAGPLEQRPLFTDEKAEARRVTRLACATLAFPRLSLGSSPLHSWQVFWPHETMPFLTLHGPKPSVLSEPPGLFSSSRVSSLTYRMTLTRKPAESL